MRSLPPGAAERLGARLGALALRGGWKRDVVLRQIAASFPGEKARWSERVAAGCYAHFGREAAVMAKLPRLERGSLSDRVSCVASSAERIGELRSGGSLLVTGHFGNWELLGAYLAERGVRLAAVVKRQRNGRFDEWLAAARRSYGIEPVYMEEARRRIPRLVDEGWTVALVADQYAGGRGIEVTFMGRSTSTFRGPARLSRALGAPLVFAAARRDGDGYAVALNPVAEADDPESTEKSVTKAWMRLLEDQVRECPEQYFWFHRRWREAERPRPSAVPNG